ncbi:hypothetical protein LZ31DRAFT_551498 [Colletotrichum somersetense]|nr:hypothetical protein LZ31DRAFT_551498 [Colletotrichum somersetense]
MALPWALAVWNGSGGRMVFRNKRAWRLSRESRSAMCLCLRKDDDDDDDNDDDDDDDDETTRL